MDTQFDLTPVLGYGFNNDDIAILRYDENKQKHNQLIITTLPYQKDHLHYQKLF